MSHVNAPFHKRTVLSHLGQRDVYVDMTHGWRRSRITVWQDVRPALGGVWFTFQVKKSKSEHEYNETVRRMRG